MHKTRGIFPEFRFYSVLFPFAWGSPSLRLPKDDAKSLVGSFMRLLLAKQKKKPPLAKHQEEAAAADSKPFPDQWPRRCQVAWFLF